MRLLILQEQHRLLQPAQLRWWRFHLGWTLDVMGWWQWWRLRVRVIGINWNPDSLRFWWNPKTLNRPSKNHVCDSIPNFISWRSDLMSVLLWHVACCGLRNVIKLILHNICLKCSYQIKLSSGKSGCWISAQYVEFFWIQWWAITASGLYWPRMICWIALF